MNDCDISSLVMLITLFINCLSLHIIYYYYISLLIYSSSKFLNISVFAESSVVGLNFSQLEYVCEVEQPCLLLLNATHGTNVTCAMVSQNEIETFQFLKLDAGHVIELNYNDVSMSDEVTVSCWNHHPPNSTAQAIVISQRVIEGEEN